jgi:hypothetical protein
MYVYDTGGILIFSARTCSCWRPCPGVTQGVSHDGGLFHEPTSIGSDRSNGAPVVLMPPLTSTLFVLTCLPLRRCFFPPLFLFASHCSSPPPLLPSASPPLAQVAPSSIPAHRPLLTTHPLQVSGPHGTATRWLESPHLLQHALQCCRATAPGLAVRHSTCIGAKLRNQVACHAAACSAHRKLQLAGVTGPGRWSESPET